MMLPSFANLMPRRSELDVYASEDLEEPGHPMLRALSLASLVIGATALGLYIGRELRQRYKFNRRTPYDFYSNAGDPVAMTEYGMGV